VDLPAWRNGELGRSSSRARGAPGVFETLRCANGALAFVDEHLARLERGARRLDLGWPPPWDARAALAELVRALPAGELGIRLVLARTEDGLELALEPRWLAPLPRPLVLWCAAPGSSPGSSPRAAPEAGGIKSLARAPYEAARAEAHAHGAWEALLVDRAGHATEGSVTNVFALLDGELVTPPLSSGVLPGVARAALLAELVRAPLTEPVRERPLPLGELSRARELVLTNALVGVAPVDRLRADPGGERQLPGREGPVAHGLAQRLSDAAARARWKPGTAAGR